MHFHCSDTGLDFYFPISFIFVFLYFSLLSTHFTLSTNCPLKKKCSLLYMWTILSNKQLKLLARFVKCHLNYLRSSKDIPFTSRVQTFNKRWKIIWDLIELTLKLFMCYSTFMAFHMKPCESITWTHAKRQLYIPKNRLISVKLVTIFKYVSKSLKPHSVAF